MNGWITRHTHATAIVVAAVLALILAMGMMRSLLAVGLLVAGVGALICFQRPILGLYGLVALIPFQVFPMAIVDSAHSFSLAQLLVKLLFAITVARLLLQRQLHFDRSAANPWILLFMLAPFFSTVNADSLREHFKETVPAVIDFYLLYFVAIHTVRTRRQLWTLLLVFIGVTSLLAVFGTLQYVTGTGVTMAYLKSRLAPLFVGPGYFEVRSLKMLSQIQSGKLSAVTSIFVNHSDYGGFLLYGFALAAAAAAMSHRRLVRLVATGVAMLLAFNILVSLARSAWLGLFAGGVAMAILVLHKRGSRLAAPVAVAGSVLLVAFLLFGRAAWGILPETVRDHFEMTLHYGSVSGSWQMRMAFWDDALHAVARAPILGRAYLSKVHNQYLGVLLQFGILGLATHLLILFTVARQLLLACVRSQDELVTILSLGALGALAGVAAHSLLWNDLFYVPASDMVFVLFMSFAGLAARETEPAKASEHNINASTASMHHVIWGILGAATALAVLAAVLVVGCEFSPFDLFSYAGGLLVAGFLLVGLVDQRRCRATANRPWTGRDIVEEYLPERAQ